jgi:hypothetical protein
MSGMQKKFEVFSINISACSFSLQKYVFYTGAWEVLIGKSQSNISQ